MNLRDCITCTFYRLTELIPPENYRLIDVELISVHADRYFYRTEILVGITRYVVQFYARRNQIGEIIATIPDSVEISR